MQTQQLQKRGRQTAPPGKLIAKVLSLAALLTLSLVTYAQNSAIPALRVVGNKVKDPAGNDIILRGMSFTWIHHTVPTYGIQFIVDKAMNEWHAKVLRLPVEPGAFLANKDAYFNNYIKPTVDYITSKGGYVIIDLHYIAQVRSNDANVKAAWTYLAPKFASYGNVLYEIYNEPRGNTVNSNEAPVFTWSEYKGYINGWIKVIRDAGAPNIILCPGLHYSQHIREFATDFFTDPMSGSRGLAGVWHAYPGSWSRDGSYYSEFDAAVAKVPVFITEWGWDEDKNGTDQNGNGVIDNWERYWGDVYGSQERLESFRNTFRQHVEEKGGHHTGWVFNRNRDGWVPVMCNDDWTPRPWPRYHGSYTKNWLAETSGNAGPRDTVPPTAPGNLKATGVASHSVVLAWQAAADSIGVTGYEVRNGAGKASTVKVSDTSYVVTGLLPGVSYTFSVSARDAAGNISPVSNAVTVKTTDDIRIDAGSATGFIEKAFMGSDSAYAALLGQANNPLARVAKTWNPDFGYTGGGTASRGNIGISGTNNPEIYRTERWGAKNYGVNVAQGQYKVVLHFAETWDRISAAGQRVFGVEVEGQKINRLDVFAETGGLNVALVKNFVVRVEDGQLNINFTALVESPIINGIEILPQRLNPAPLLRVEAGSATSYTDHAGNVWVADHGFAGGGTVDRGNIPVANTTTPRIYQTERYNVNAYLLRVPNGTYRVNLHFAETYDGITRSGQRVFHAGVEDSVISNIDVFAETGGRNRALVKSALVTVADGYLNIDFKGVVQSPMINGIEILPVEAKPGSARMTTPGKAASVEANSVNLHPVPASSHFTVRLPGEFGSGNVLVQDVLSKTIQAIPFPDGARSVDVSTAGLQDGVYFVSVVTRAGRIVKRIVVHK